MATQKGTGLVERAVREALGTLVSANMCDQLIARSLAEHGLAAIPEGGPELGQWLEGGLRGQVETAVGPDAADLLLSQLGPIAAYAAIAMPRPREAIVNDPASQARRISSRPSRATGRGAAPDPFWDAPPLPDFDDEPEGATALRPEARDDGWGAAEDAAPRPISFESGPPTGMYSNKELSFSPIPDNANAHPRNGVRTLPPTQSVSDRPTHEALHTTRPQETSMSPGKAMPYVLTATADATDLEALRRYLANNAQVVHIPDLVGLLDALETGQLVEPIVLIDCQRPTVHVTSVAAIGEDLPRGTTVVLWGADDPTWAQLDRERTPACRWVRCSREATTDDVGSLCSMLLG
jgi:hypothetical protein